MILGVLSSLVAALIAGIITISWKSFIVPFVIENFGERIKIHSSWLGNLDFGSGTLHGIKLQVRKLGFKVTGELEFTSGRHVGKKYYISGRFQSNILTFHYYPFAQYSTSQGTATFKRVKDGEKLVGYFAYFSQDKDIIATVPCELNPIST